MSNIRSAQSRNVYLPVRIVLFLVLFSTGFYLAGQWTLELNRSTEGAVTSTKTWKFAGQIPLLSGSTDHIHEVKIHTLKHFSRYGRVYKKYELRLIGDKEMSYPDGEAYFLVHRFLQDTSQRNRTFAPQRDVRGIALAWLLLGLAVWLGVELAAEFTQKRSPTRAIWRSLVNVPAPLLIVLLLGLPCALLAFLLWGNQWVGPEATAKVQLLMESARKDDVRGLEQAITKGVNINTREGQSMPALSLAARMGCLNAVDALLKAGADPEVWDSDDETPLITSIRAEKKEVAIHLLDAGCEARSWASDGRSALHLAAKQGNAALVRKLLEHGAEVGVKDRSGFPPLVAAVSSKSLETVQVLLQAGADPNQSMPLGLTPMNTLGNDGAIREAMTKASKH